MNHFLLLGNIGMGEVIVLVLFVLLFFGAKRIPDLMKSMGKGVRNFKEGMNDLQKEVKDDPKSEEAKK